MRHERKTCTSIQVGPNYRGLLTVFWGIKQQSTTDLEGMIPALDGVVSFNFASATAPKRSKNAKRHSIQDRADVVVVVSFLFFLRPANSTNTSMRAAYTSRSVVGEASSPSRGPSRRSASPRPSAHLVLPHQSAVFEQEKAVRSRMRAASRRIA